jgi:anti-sigma factor RsiW
MYESTNGERVTIYTSKTNEPRTSFRYKVSETFGALSWSEGGYGWVVSGPDDKPRLKSIANALYEQLENRTPPPPSRSSANQLISRRGS